MRRRDFAFGLGVTAMAARPAESKFEPAAQILRKAAESGQLRAATIYVRHGGDAFQRAFGEAQSPATVFLIASITKPMTAAGVMLLADRGELRLDDPVHKHIPEFTQGDRKLMTVRHLLTHTSGLPDMLPENTELRKRHAPLSEFVARTIRTPLLFKPGSKVQYQSMGILLAAEIAQRITRTPFPEFLAREVFEPLGMARTALGLGQFEIGDTALSQVDSSPDFREGNTASWDWNSPYWRGLAAPWGGAHSTGADIAAFFGYFLKPDGRVLKPQTAASMIVDQTEGLNEPRGLGFAVKPGSFGRACSPLTFGHGGSTGTVAWGDPQTGAICITLTTLPAVVSNKLLLRPVSDLVSEAV